ncbi:general vesicular transport factor p115-like [Lingula anatina]|uniref:General vesicular transport factor p115-like n=1 Tax=Lingula anatina TaxID=7574 RepID=A0A1S3INT6_LINAN|nr:general vesicular transport factor p115-like [Lingula anatina]|eukprot:XP_013399199.1 general vesicular transport factor p115-like [Lingula anatina]
MNCNIFQKFRLEVGTQSMEILTDVLQKDRSDAEIMGYALDTLYNVTSNEPTEEEDENATSEDLGGMFTEIFIKKPENVSLLLSLLEEYDFHVRWPTVKFLTALLSNKTKEVQEIVLVSPMGVSKLMDLLSDSREIIRNDALLLLIQLTKNNANIQKIVAFENAFERLLEVISDEGATDGGIVVEDCLLLLCNLLKNNTSNQNFFKEGSFIQQLPRFFSLDSSREADQVGWSAQKVTNMHLCLQVVRTLVSPSNPQQHTAMCQKVMNQCGLLKQLCSILMASGVPADVLTETINTVSEVIRGNQANQEFFASVMAPSNPPRPAIVVLLMSMVNEKQPFVLRCAVLYCFQSFLYKNSLGQSQIITTLLPTSADVNTITAGQLLCGGLFSTDAVSNWFASVALLHAIVDNPIQKEQLLRVQLATNLGNPPVSLLQQCCNLLAKGGQLQTRVGLLMLMGVWLSDCPIAVSHFLHNPANVPFLISQVSASEGDEQELLVQGLCAYLLGICLCFNNEDVQNFDKPSLQQVIERRIGLETFTDKLTQVPKYESYNKAAKKPQLTHKHPSEVLFDFEFTRHFKVLENDIVKAVQLDHKEEKKKQANIEQHDSIVAQYKDLIKEQDEELSRVRIRLKEVEAKNAEAEQQMKEMKEQIQQVKDQNALLKASKGSLTNQNEVGKVNGSDEVARLQELVETQQTEIEEKNQTVEKLKNELTIAEAKVLVQNGEGSSGEQDPADSAVLQATVNRVKADMEQLQQSLAAKDTELTDMKQKFHEAEKQISELREQASQKQQTGLDGTAVVAEKDAMVTQVTDLERQLAMLEDQNKKVCEEKTSLQERLKKANQDNLNLQEKHNKILEENKKMELERNEKEDEVNSTKKEMEDLLVLLADQDTKLSEYKKKLKGLGEKIDDDDDDDDEDYDDDDDDAEDEEDKE